jgi:hypothetical protein
MFRVVWLFSWFLSMSIYSFKNNYEMMWNIILGEVGSQVYDVH